MQEAEKDYKIVVSKKEADDYSDRLQKVINILINSLTEKERK